MRYFARMVAGFRSPPCCALNNGDPSFPQIIRIEALPPGCALTQLVRSYTWPLIADQHEEAELCIATPAMVLPVGTGVWVTGVVVVGVGVLVVVAGFAGGVKGIVAAVSTIGATTDVSESCERFFSEEPNTAKNAPPMMMTPIITEMIIFFVCIGTVYSCLRKKKKHRSVSLVSLPNNYSCGTNNPFSHEVPFLNNAFDFMIK